MGRSVEVAVSDVKQTNFKVVYGSDGGLGEQVRYFSAFQMVDAVELFTDWVTSYKSDKAVKAAYVQLIRIDPCGLPEGTDLMAWTKMDSIYLASKGSLTPL